MKSDKKPYDTAFKHLADQDPEALLRLVGALPAGATARKLSREISAPALATDQPYEVIGEGLHYIAHIEAQTRWKPDVPNRITEYDAIFWINWRMPVRSFALVLTLEGFPKDAPTHCVVEADGLTLISRFTIVRLWELSAEAALAQKRDILLPFIPLMKGGDERLEYCARELERIEDEGQRRALALHFVSLGSLRYNKDDLLNLLGRVTMIPMHVLRETPFIQSISEEAREEGREEGVVIGREEGREVVVEMLLHAISKRFPKLDFSPEIERVRNIEALKQLFFDLDQIPDEEALRQRFAVLSPISQN